jgi:hypothetical protein
MTGPQQKRLDRLRIRQAARLRYVIALRSTGASNAEIARVLNITRGRAFQLIQQARRRYGPLESNEGTAWAERLHAFLAVTSRDHG